MQSRSLRTAWGGSRLLATALARLAHDTGLLWLHVLGHVKWNRE